MMMRMVLDVGEEGQDIIISTAQCRLFFYHFTVGGYVGRYIDKVEMKTIETWKTDR